MKVVQRYQTADGILHETRELAAKHVERLYSDALLSLSHECTRIIQCTKMEQQYVKVAEFLDANLQKFLELQRLKDDTEVKPEPDPWDE